MPACASSPIAVLAAHSGPLTDGADPGKVTADLLVALATVPDPRKRRGVRHRLVTVLAAAVSAVLAGARSYVAIAEWAHDLPVSVRVRLGIGRRGPSESTFRRILQAVEADTLDRVMSSWLAQRAAADPAADPADHPGADPDNRPAAAPVAAPVAAPGTAAAVPARPARAGEPRRAIAVDGKSARGARGADGRPAHLFAAFDHASGVVLGQTQVEEKTNEITAFAPLLDRLDLTDTVITADALHAQDRHADYLHERGGHYVFIVKGNRPTLHTQLTGLPWRDVPVVDLSHARGHGRVESRGLKLTAVTGIAGAGIAFPHAQLAAQIIRRRHPLGVTGPAHTETVYAVTDLGWNQIRPGRLAEIIRGHWTIENRLHWIRDVVFSEDHCQIRTGNGPAVMATLRNFAVSRHRLAGATNIAAACRHASRHPSRATALLT